MCSLSKSVHTSAEKSNYPVQELYVCNSTEICETGLARLRLLYFTLQRLKCDCKIIYMNDAKNILINYYEPVNL